jgi:hypothetical protein
MVPVSMLAAAWCACLPFSFEIDTANWPGGITVNAVMSLEATDGQKLDMPIQLGPTADPGQVRFTIQEVLKDDGWVVRQDSGTKLVVLGVKKSPVKAVKWKSAQWSPVVRLVGRPS